MIKFYEFRQRCQSTYYKLLSNINCQAKAKKLSDADVEKNENTFINMESLPQTDSTIENQQISTLNEPSFINFAQDIADDDNIVLSEKHHAELIMNDSTVIETPMKESISPYPKVATEILNYVEKTMSYKCFHCKQLFDDLTIATNHCLTCLESSTKELQRTKEQNKNPPLNDYPENLMNYAEVLVTDAEEEKNESIPQLNESKTVVKCRKYCLHTKCRLSGRLEKKNYACTECGKFFASGCLLKRHLMVHTGERPFQCETCGRKFSQVGALNFHKKIHIKAPYSCTICNKPFMRPSDTEKHMRTHTGEKPFSCSICHKHFAQTTALQQHERIHTGAKPYVCEICGKAFSQSANKRKHVRIHKEGAKPHVCKTCGRSFSDIMEMELHRAAHGGGKPRECDYCGERFRKLSEISDHIRRLHTFERPYQCVVCSKAFFSMYSLKQHIMVHTGQKPHSCSKCDLKFAQKGNLLKHYSRKHTNQLYTGNESCDENSSGNEEILEEEIIDVSESIEIKEKLS